MSFDRVYLQKTAEFEQPPNCVFASVELSTICLYFPFVFCVVLRFPMSTQSDASSALFLSDPGRSAELKAALEPLAGVLDRAARWWRDAVAACSQVGDLICGKEGNSLATGPQAQHGSVSDALGTRAWRRAMPGICAAPSDALPVTMAHLLELPVVALRIAHAIGAWGEHARLVIAAHAFVSAAEPPPSGTPPSAQQVQVPRGSVDATPYGRSRRLVLACTGSPSYGAGWLAAEPTRAAQASFAPACSGWLAECLRQLAPRILRNEQLLDGASRAWDEDITPLSSLAEQLPSSDFGASHAGASRATAASSLTTLREGATGGISRGGEAAGLPADPAEAAAIAARAAMTSTGGSSTSDLSRRSLALSVAIERGSLLSGTLGSAGTGAARGSAMSSRRSYGTTAAAFAGVGIGRVVPRSAGSAAMS